MDVAMPSTRAPHPSLAGSPPAPRATRARLEELLAAVLDGDLVTALHEVERAGGPAAFGDDEALVEALLAERTLGLERGDAQQIARAIAADVGKRAAEPEVAARALLTRLVEALGLSARVRSSTDPVVIDVPPARTSEPRPATEVAARETSEDRGARDPERRRGPPAGPVRALGASPATTTRASLTRTQALVEEGLIPPPMARATGALNVRGYLKDLFASQTWLPRVDVVTVAFAPHIAPGVYGLQRRALPGASSEVALDVDEIAARLGPGRAIDDATRARLEEELAAEGRAVDLSALRIHDGPEADALCRDLEAEAFALGEDLVFRAGAFRPETPQGLHLLVHELTHVWQQAHGEVHPGLDTSPALEAEAEEVAERIAAEVAPAPAPTPAPAPATAPAPAPAHAPAPALAPNPAPAPDGDAVQLCGPREMNKRDNPPRGRKTKKDEDPDPRFTGALFKDEPEPEDPKGTEECEACPEPDLEHQSFQPLRPLPDKKPAPGQKKVELALAGHKIKVEVPEGQADGEVEIVFKDNPSPFAALVFKKAKLRFDSDLRVLDGEISCAVALGNYIQVANTTLRVFEDGQIGAEIRGIEINVADNLRATVDLVIGPEGVWGMCTATADKLFVSDLVTVKDGLVHVRVDKSGAVSAHGAVTIQVHGVGEATLEACYVDGKWAGRILLARREDLVIVPGVVLEEIELEGCFEPDEWWVRGHAKVRLFDKFRVTADAKYHWKEGEGKWSFEGWLDQIEPVELGADVSLQKVEAHAKYEEGVWEPLTFHAELHHPWVLGTLDGHWKIEENLWSGFGKVELTRQLPMGDSGITLDQAEVTAYVVDNELTEIHGKAAATFPFQGQPTFELSCKDAVYKVKEEALWATADLRSIRDIVFGKETGFHAIIREGAGATAIVEASELKKTLGGMAFEARHQDKLLGDGGLWFNWVPGGGVNAGGKFDLRERFGLPDYTNGPLYLLPLPGHFEFLVENSQPKFIEAQGVGFEIAQGGAGGEGGTGLIGGVVSGRFDFDTNLGDLSGTARVVRSWTEPLGEFGSVTFLESETDNLTVTVQKSALTRAEGHLDVQLDVDESEHVKAFTLLGHVDGRYDPKTGKVSGEVGAELKTDLDVSIGDSGDRVIIKEGSWFTTTMTESQLDVFRMQLVVQYIRKGELFLEGACKEALFDFKTGELDFLGSLTLKQDIEKQLGESGYSIALVKDVTNLEVEVRKNRLIRIGGDIAVQLREGGDPLLEGSLLNADYRIEEGLFSGDLDLGLKKDLVWPKRADDRAALPPTLQVELSRGSHVHGRIQDNVFDQAGVELLGRVHYRGKEQAEAYLNGTWNLVSDRFDLDGHFRLTSDLVLGAEAVADETDLSAWALVFVKDSEVTVGVRANVFQPVGVDVKMQLRRAGEACAKGNVTGQYVFGDAAGFNGKIHVEVMKEIGLGRAGRFDIALSPETVGDGDVAQNALTSANLTLVLLAKEQGKPKARLGLQVDYAGGDEFSGHADFTVLDPMRLGERRMGSALYAVDLNTRTHAAIGLDKNMLTAFSGAVGIDVLKDEAPFAEGDFTLDYDFSNPDATVTAEGALRLIGRLELGTVGKYAFSLEGGSNIKGRIEDGGLAWIDGKMTLGVATAKEGRFAELVIQGRYEGGTKPKFDGSAAATVLKEHDLGSIKNYAFLLQPSSGFSIVLKDSAFTEMHGDIGLIARQREKKKDGMNGDVSMTLSGDAVKQGDKWKIDGRATATVTGSIKVGTAGDYVFWIQGGSGLDVEVRDSRLVAVEGTLNGKVTEKGKGFLGFDCWVRYAAAEDESEPGWVDARGGCKLLGEKELYRNGGFAFSLMPTQGYTALIVVEKNEVKEVGGTLAFRLENTNAKPQPLRVVGTATGHYDNTTGIFSGAGDIKLESDLEFAMGKNKIVLEKGSGGMTRIEKNELERLGGTLKGRFDDADGPLVRVVASGDFDAKTPELVTLEGSATLLRELKLGPDGSPWIIVDKGLSCTVRMAHNKLTYAAGKNGRFKVPALRLTGGFDHITMNAEGPETKYSGKGFLEMEMLKEDKEKGRKLKGRLDLEYREDDTWNAKGTVDYNITPYLGGQITAEMDQNLDPVLGGTLVMKKKEMLPARDLFEMKFPIIPDMTIPVAGIAGFGFGARGYFGLSSLPMLLSASVGVQNFRPRQMNVPDFSAEAEIDWGLRLKAGAMGYLDARLSVLIASAAIGIKGTAELAGDAMVKAKGKIAGSQGKYWGELGVGLSFAPSVTLKAQPYAKASLFSYEWEKAWDAYSYDLGEVFKYEWGSTYKFGDQPEAPKSNGDRQPASVAGAPRQNMGRVNSKTEAESFGQERAAPAVGATQGRPQMESGEDLKKKKEKEEADSMEGLEKDGKEAADLGSVMAAVGNIMTQLGHILGSLMFGPIGLVLCLAWKWMTGALKKLYNDWCTVRDYVWNNWNKIKEYLPDWFVDFIDFMKNPLSAAEKWWNADEYARKAVHAGEHLKAMAPVRGNLVKNLFKGWAGEGDRRAIEDVFELSLNKGDLRQVLTESGYTEHNYGASWYRHGNWDGSRLQKIFKAAGYNVNPGIGSALLLDEDETTARPSDAETMHAHAAEGISGGGGPLPYQHEIQAAFGEHDVSGVEAHTGSAAAAASEAMGANAYATGDHVAFGGAPDLHTAAHEAAHVVQQRQGVSLDAGVGESGDAYEQHADAVADKVVAGESAEGLLGAKAGTGASGAAVQHDKKEPEVVTVDKDKTGDKEESGNDKTGKTKIELGVHPEGDASAEVTSQELLDIFGDIEKRGTVLLRRKEEATGLSGPELEKLLALETAFAEVKTALAAEFAEVKKAEAAAEQSTGAETGTDQVATDDAEKSEPAGTGGEDPVKALREARVKAVAAFEAAAAAAIEVLDAFERTLAELGTFLADYTKTVKLNWFGNPDKPLRDRLREVVELAVTRPPAGVIDNWIRQAYGFNELTARTASERAGLLERLNGLRKQYQGTSPYEMVMRLGALAKVPGCTWATNIDVLLAIVSMTPSLLRAALELANKARKVSKAELAQVGPSADVVKELAKAKDDKQRLALIRDYVARWKGNEAALKDARGNAELQRSLAVMSSVNLLAAQEMLLKGTSITLDDTGLVVEGEGGKKSALAESDPGLALEMLSVADPGREKKWIADNLPKVLTALNLLRVRIDAAVLGGKPVAEADRKALDAFVTRVGTSERVINFLAQRDDAFLRGTFLKLVGFHEHEATAVEPVAEKEETPLDDIKHWHDARELDVSGGETGSTNTLKKAFLTGAHDDLMLGAQELANTEDVEFGHDAVTGTKLVKHLREQNLAALKEILGSPPLPIKVTYMLDRFEEAEGKSFWASHHFLDQSPQQQAALRALFGYEDAGALPYAAKLEELQVVLRDMHEIEVGNAADFLGGYLESAFELAVEIHGALKDDTPHHEAVVRNGRVPRTAQQVLLNVFAHEHDIDLITYTRNLLNEWSIYGAGGVHFGAEALAKTLKDLFGIELKFLNGEGARGVDLAHTDQTAELITGAGADKERIVKEGMKVPPGFDDAAAYRAAENIYGVLHATQRTVGFLKEEGIEKAGGKEEVRKADIFEASVLGGDLPGLMSLMAWRSRIKTIVLSIKSMSSDTRDAIDAAFRNRFGKTLLAECAHHEKADELAFTMDRDSEDEHDALLAAISEDARAKRTEALLDHAATMPGAARAKLLANEPLMESIREALGLDKTSEFEALLMGKATLAELIKKRDLYGKDDDEGAKKDAERAIKMMTRELHLKYPGALDDKHASHAEHAEAFKAEWRKTLVQLAIDEEMLEIAAGSKVFGMFGGFMTALEIQQFQALLLGGGKASKVDALLEHYRNRGAWSAWNKQQFKADLGALTAAELAVVASDIQIRAIIAKELSPDQQAECLEILEGGATKDLALIEKRASIKQRVFGLDGDALVAAIRALDFEAWSLLRTDVELVETLLAKVKGADQPIRDALLLDENGRPRAEATPKGHGALDRNRAMAEFHFQRLKALLIEAAKKKPGTLLEQVAAIFALEVSIVSDSPETDKLAGLAGGDLLAWEESATPSTDGEPQTLGHHDAMKLSVRKKLVVDPEIEQAIADSLGKIGGSAYEKYLPVIDQALLAKADPALHIFAYYAGNHEMVLSEGDANAFVRAFNSAKLVDGSAGLVKAIQLASPETFLTRFTDIAKLGDQLDAYAKARSSKDEKEVFASKMQLEKLRRTQIEMSEWATQMVAKLTDTADKKAMEEAVQARLLELLGSGGLADTKKVEAVLAAFKDKNLPKEIFAEIFGANLEAQAILDKVAETHFERPGNKKSAGQTALTGSIKNAAEDTKGYLEASDVEKMKEAEAVVTEIHAEIDQRKDQIIAWALKGADLLVSTAAGLVVPGAPLWIHLVKSAGLILAKHTLKADVAEGGLDGFIKAVCKDALKQTLDWVIVGQLRPYLLDSWTGIFAEGKLVESIGITGLEKLDEHLRSVVDDGVKEVFSTVSGALADPKNWRQLSERGAVAMMQDLGAKLTELDVEKALSEVLEGSLDAVVKGLNAELGEQMKDLSEGWIEGLFGKEADKEAKAFDKLLISREAVEQWAGGPTVVANLQAAFEGMKKAGLGEVMDGLPSVIAGDADAQLEYVKSWTKYVIDGGLATVAQVLNDIPKIIDDPKAYLDMTVFGASAIVKGKLDVNALPAAAWAWIVEKATAAGGKAQEALTAAWKRYRTAAELVDAGGEDEQIFADMFDAKDSSKAWLVKGFLETRKQEGHYGKTSYATFQREFESLATELLSGVEPEYLPLARTELAKALASKGLGGIAGHSHHPGTNASLSEERRQDLKKAVEKAITKEKEKRAATGTKSKDTVQKKEKAGGKWEAVRPDPVLERATARLAHMAMVAPEAPNRDAEPIDTGDASAESAGEEGQDEAPSGPLEVRVNLTEVITETAGVAPKSATALGQVVPVSTLTLKGYEEKDGVVEAEVEHHTDFQWGVDSRGRKDASPGAASLELEPEGSKRAGMKQFWAMASDIWPLPGLNAPPMLEYWSREHIEEHERFHIDDMRKWLAGHAKQVAEEAFTEKEVTASYLGLQLKTAGMRAKNAVDAGLIDHMSAGLDPTTDYYNQPGEQRAYAAGMPGLLGFAAQILAAGVRLMQAAEQEGTPKEKGDAGEEGGTGELRPGTASLVMREQHEHEDNHPERVPGLGEKESGGDGDKAIWPPDTSFTVDVEVVQDEVLEAKSFGSVRPEWQVRDVTSESDGKKVRIAGKVHVILHWNIQSRGKKDATPALASLEPETAPDYQGMGLKVYEAMFLDLVPDAQNFPAQRAYWSREHAEMHERVHLDDYTAWAQASGPTVANDAWMMRSYRPDHLGEDVEAQRVETEKQLMYAAMKDLQGMPPKDYLQQPTEVNAFGTVAPKLRALAEAIRAAGEALAKKEREEEESGEGAASDGAASEESESKESIGEEGALDAADASRERPVVARYQIVNETRRGLELADDVFGAMQTDFEQHGLVMEFKPDVAELQGTLRAVHRWDVQTLDRAQASVERATNAPETLKDYAGASRVYEIMALDMLPGDKNVPNQIRYTNTDLIELHEQVHVQDSIGFVERNAQAILQRCWGELTVSPDLRDYWLEQAPDAMRTELTMAQMAELKGDPEKDYYDQPTEIHAYGVCAPLFDALARDIMKAGQALDHQDAEGLGAKAGAASTGVLDPTPNDDLDRTMSERSAASVPGGSPASAPAEHPKNEAGPTPSEGRFVHFVPGNLKVESSVSRGLDLDADAFGAVRQDFAMSAASATMVDGQPRVDATLHITYRWDVQSKGSMQASLDLVTNEPETLDPQYAKYKVWQVMAASVRPDAKNMPSFAPYWDEAEAIAHERFHVEDDQQWAAKEGAAKLGEGWSLAAFEVAGSETPEAGTVAEKARLWAPIVADFFERASNAYYLGGKSDPGYAARAGERRAYGARASFLAALADRIEARGRELESEEARARGEAGAERTTSQLDIAGGSSSDAGDGPALMGGDGPGTLPKGGTNDTVREVTAPESVAHGGGDRQVRRIEIEPNRAEALGGYLLPRVAVTLAFVPNPHDYESALGADLDTFLSNKFSPWLINATLQLGRGVAPSVSSPLPARQEYEAKLDALFRDLQGTPTGHFLADFVASEPLMWQLLALDETTWDKVKANPDRQPNLSTDVNGVPVTLEVTASGRLDPGPRTASTFDAEERKGLDVLFELLVAEALEPYIAKGGKAGPEAAQRLDQATQAMTGRLARFGMSIRLVGAEMTQSGLAYEPPLGDSQAVRTEEGFAKGKGMATVVASADAEEEAQESTSLEMTTVEVERSFFQKVIGAAKETKEVEAVVKRGSFTRELAEMMKRHPDLSITECAKKLIRETQLEAQQAQIFTIGEDDVDAAEAGESEAGKEKVAKNKRALVAGCNEYPPDINDLAGALNDSKTMKSLLEARGFVVDHLQDPKLAEWLDALKRLADGAQGGDDVVIYFAGHGSSAGSSRRPPGLILSDGEVHKHTSLQAGVANLRQRDIDVELVIDVCHSGQATDLAEERFFAGSKKVQDVDANDERLKTLFGALDLLGDQVDRHYFGQRTTKGSRPDEIVEDRLSRHDRQTYEDPEVVRAMLGRLVEHHKSFTVLTGQELLDRELYAQVNGKGGLTALRALVGLARQRARDAYLSRVGGAAAQQERKKVE